MTISVASSMTIRLRLNTTAPMRPDQNMMSVATRNDVPSSWPSVRKVRTPEAGERAAAADPAPSGRPGSRPTGPRPRGTLLVRRPLSVWRPRVRAIIRGAAMGLGDLATVGATLWLRSWSPCSATDEDGRERCAPNVAGCCGCCSSWCSVLRLAQDCHSA